MMSVKFSPISTVLSTQKDIQTYISGGEQEGQVSSGLGSQTSNRSGLISRGLYTASRMLPSQVYKW